MKNRDKFTVTDIAKELGVTRQTIYYWIKKKWFRTVSKKTPPTREKNNKKLPSSATPTAARLTWEEMQKALLHKKAMLLFALNPFYEL